jgi:hypothetical protein
LASRNEVELTVRNLLGQQMHTFNQGSQSSGSHAIKINTSQFARGIYFYTLKVGGQEITKKMIVSK